MRGPGHGIGLGGFGAYGIFTDIMAGLIFLICLAVVVGLLFVIVRFLLVATKAAEIYVAKNSAGTPVERPVAPASATATPLVTDTAATPTRPVTRAPRRPSSGSGTGTSA